MSYTSESILRHGTRVSEVLEYIVLLGYKRINVSKYELKNEVGQFYYFEEKDYKSWSAVGVSVFCNKAIVSVTTHSNVSRSYYDLAMQNKLIKGLKNIFGGHFTTDAGRNRCVRLVGKPPSAAESGCHLAFDRFGHNIIRAGIYMEFRGFNEKHWENSGKLWVMDTINPRLLSNNLILPFLVAILEDYFKSTFISILKNSDRKELIFKGARLSSDQLCNVSSSNISIEEAVAENLSFQRITSICQHYKLMDPKIDLASVLRKPYKKRKCTLFDELNIAVKMRHKFIHAGESNLELEDLKVWNLLDVIEAAVVRVYKFITEYNGWAYDKGWSAGNRHIRKKRHI